MNNQFYLSDTEIFSLREPVAMWLPNYMYQCDLGTNRSLKLVIKKKRERFYVNAKHYSRLHSIFLLLLFEFCEHTENLVTLKKGCL